MPTNKPAESAPANAVVPASNASADPALNYQILYGILKCLSIPELINFRNVLANKLKTGANPRATKADIFNIRAMLMCSEAVWKDKLQRYYPAYYKSYTQEKTLIARYGWQAAFFRVQDLLHRGMDSQAIAIMKAVKNNNLAALKNAEERIIDDLVEHENNTRNWIMQKDGGSILSEACKFKNQNVLNYFYSLVCKRLPDNHMLLDWAIKLNQASEVKRLCQCLSVDLNQPLPPQNFTPLMSAIEKESLEVVKILVNGGTDLNYKLPTFGSYLNLAIEKGDVECARFLLQCCPDLLRVPDSTGKMPLFRAVCKKDYPMAKLLIEEFGATIDDGIPQGGFTTLHAAVHQGCADIVQLLAEHRANINAVLVDTYGATPLHYAFQSKSGPSMALILLRHGADASRPFDGKNAYQLFLKQTETQSLPPENMALMGLYDYIARSSNYVERSAHNAAVALRDVVVFGSDPRTLNQHRHVFQNRYSEIGSYYHSLLKEELSTEPAPAPQQATAPALRLT